MKKESKYFPLSELKQSEKAKVISLEGGKGFLAHLNDMGIRVGVIVEMISNSGGPVHIKVGESRFAIGHEMAKRIFVEKFY
ncbi:MAG TPA: FeoA family protein [Victivallales bacterium]|nr:FeoA family protein [Victivallales bacterium]HRR05805.1 FeoA family protein [Victivallales bacterium]HRR28760.1 FeoA family protein [Victivallales bacterium]HRU02298.1 FeoA family protein [Victivallales bacterium]